MQRFNSGLRKQESPPYCRGVRYRGGVPVEEEFTPQQVVQQLEAKLNKKLSAVIDLTFTSRYYDCRVCILAVRGCVLAVRGCGLAVRSSERVWLCSEGCGLA
jgi:hypothetical protein